MTLAKLRAHGVNTAIHHVPFSLPFAYVAAFLAAGGVPELRTLALITVCMVAGNLAAIAYDNIADLRYDKQQPRLRFRPLVNGALTVREAWASIAACAAVLVLATAMLPPICLKLLPLAVIPSIVYPYTKRFTPLCHQCLGVAIAMGVGGSWIAVRGTIDAPIIALCAGYVFWIGAFDTIYGAQDEAFDLRHGLHSAATALGAKGAVAAAKAGHGVALVCFALAGALANAGALYHVGLALTAAYLAHAYANMWRGYMPNNGLVSFAICGFTWLSLI